MKNNTLFSFVMLPVALWLIPEFASSQANFWEKTSEPLVEVCAVAFTSSGNVLIGSNYWTPPLFGIMQSTNGGGDWVQTSTNQTQAIAINSMGHIFAGGDGIMRSTDQGASWTKLYTPNIGNSVEALAINSNGVIYAASNNHNWEPGKVKSAILRSVNNGETWERLNLPKSFWDFDVYSFAIDRHGYIFAGTTRGIIRSMDNGRIWRIVLTKLSLKSYLADWHITIDPTGDLYVASSVGIFRSKVAARGARWKKASTLSNAPFIRSMSAMQSGNLFVTTWAHGVYHSTDKGITWKQMNSGLDTSDVYTLLPGPDGYLYAGTPVGLYKSTMPIPSHNKLQPTLEPDQDLPTKFSLGQNYPNPFNPSTTISFELKQEALVTLKVYNTLGQEVAELIHNELMDEGEQEVEFDASTLSSGVYYYKIVAQDIERSSVLYSQMKKMLLVK